jgi:uncharacterized protein (DUF1697 family)
MTGYAAFLRGVNLGPQRRASSTMLRARFEEMGFLNVNTFRTSGNVVFSAGREPAAKLTARIEEDLAESLGFEVAVFLRTDTEVRVMAKQRPFSGNVVGSSRGKLQVVMLHRRPAPRLRKEILALSTDQDKLAFADRELYWLPSGGVRDSSLNLKTIEKLLGPTTMRTKDTIEQLAAKYFARSSSRQPA